jgi:hypothetical protein
LFNKIEQSEFMNRPPLALTIIYKRQRKYHRRHRRHTDEHEGITRRPAITTGHRPTTMAVVVGDEVGITGMSWRSQNENDYAQYENGPHLKTQSSKLSHNPDADV